MNGLLKKMLVFLVVMALVAAAGWYGRKAYKRASEHRAVAEAAQFLKKNDTRNALLSLQRALQVNPRSMPAITMMADLLESAGVPAVQSWRIRAVQLEPDNPTNRLRLAETALKLHDFKTAKDALDAAQEKAKDTAVYQKLEGALAWSLGSNQMAEHYFQQAQRMEPSNLSVTLNLATIGLASTNPAVVSASRAAMEQVAARPEFRTSALRHLLSDATLRKDYPAAAGYAAEIVKDPQATAQDRINYLETLKLATNRGFSSYLAEEKELAGKSPVEAFALARWMVAVESPSTALQWLRSLPETTQTNQPVPLIMSDCEIDLKDWKGLLSLVEKQDWSEANCFRLALVSLADRSLQDEAGAQTAWRKAVHLSAHRLDRLVRLSEVTAAWGWEAENTEVLNDIATDFPKEKWAVIRLEARFYAAGNTRELGNLLSRAHAADTTDVRWKNDLANVSLLRKSDLENAHRLAREAYATAPKNPAFISTYAYSLLLQNKGEEAVKVCDELNADSLKDPEIAAYYGVVEAQAGNKDAAREPLKRAAAAKLLPEEKELVRNAMAKLSAAGT